jgi:hypothetical protein
MATTPTDDLLANSDRTVGVYGYPFLALSKSLKREALLFDQIGIPAVAQLRSEVTQFEERLRVAELVWLRDMGIVRDLPSFRGLLARVSGKRIDLSRPTMTGGVNRTSKIHFRGCTVLTYAPTESMHFPYCRTADGDPPQIKMAAPTGAANGDFTLAEMLNELRIIRERNPPG